MTSSLDMIRGRSNIVTLTNNSGGALVAGDVCVQDTSADENATTTTSAASTLKVFVAAESIGIGAAGRFYESGYCPLVNVNASVTRGRFLFTHTVAKQAAENATYGSGAFGKILKSGTTPSAIIYSQTAQIGGTGATIYQAAYGSPPTPVDGDDWHVSDQGSIAHRASSAWSYYGPLFPIVIPPDSGSWIAMSTTTGLTASFTTGAVDLYNTQSPGGEHLRGYVRAVPTPKIVTASFYFLIDGNAYCHCGIVTSDGTQFRSFMYRGSDGSIQRTNWTNNETWSSEATLLGQGAASFKGPLLHMQWDETDVTNLVIRVSPNGRQWRQVLSEAKTTFLTTTQVGFGVYCTGGTTGQMTLVNWREGS